MADSHEIVRVGLIGPGFRLMDVVEKLDKQCDQVKIAGLFDPNPESIKKCQARCDASEAIIFDSFESLCESDQIDWIMIGSWNCFHAEHAIKALSCGKHVFCEKPLATNFDDCLAMQKAKNDAPGQIFSFGLVLRYATLYNKINEIVKSGQIGDLMSFEFNETLEFNHGGYIHQDWRRQTELAGTHLLEKCCHDVDLVNWIIGSKAKRVASFGNCSFFTEANKHHQDRIGPNKEGRPAYQGWMYSHETPFRDDKDIVDSQVGILEYENGVNVTFHTSCNAGIPERRMYILGTKGAVRADLITGKIELRLIDWEAPTTVIDATGGGHGDGDIIMVKGIIDTMTKGVAPQASLEDGLVAAATCFAMDKAMDEGTVIELTEWWEKAGLNEKACCAK
ncbi:Gfo/Idh/MocA family oxidoreductase [Planctomycetota bacterium]|nr:Gfo/Idh/MocA family oxidoreductase [Planctomycetota bacterium]